MASGISSNAVSINFFLQYRSTSIMCQGKDLGISYSYNYSFLIIFGKYSSYSFEGWVPKQVKIKKKKKHA